MRILGVFLNSTLDILFPRNEKDLSISKINIEDLEKIENTKVNATSNIISFFPYSNENIRGLIWRFKYRGDKNVAKIIAKAMYERIMNNLEDEMNPTKNQKYILVPIPISKSRLRERGFNQCELLARAIAKENPEMFEVSILLKKKSGSEHQARTKTKTERIKNIKGTFSVIKKPDESPIIIIDDVTTTGATIGEAIWVLKKMGAKNVKAFTFAH